MLNTKPADVIYADVIYYGGPIVTMISDGHRVDALAVKDGKILPHWTGKGCLRTERKGD